MGQWAAYKNAPFLEGDTFNASLTIVVFVATVFVNEEMRRGFVSDPIMEAVKGYVGAKGKRRRVFY